MNRSDMAVVFTKYGNLRQILAPFQNLPSVTTVFSDDKNLIAGQGSLKQVLTTQTTDSVNSGAPHCGRTDSLGYGYVSTWKMQTPKPHLPQGLALLCGCSGNLCGFHSHTFDICYLCWRSSKNQWNISTYQTEFEYWGKVTCNKHARATCQT